MLAQMSILMLTLGALALSQGISVCATLTLGCFLQGLAPMPATWRSWTAWRCGMVMIQSHARLWSTQSGGHLETMAVSTSLGQTKTGKLMTAPSTQENICEFATYKLVTITKVFNSLGAETHEVRGESEYSYGRWRCISNSHIQLSLVCGGANLMKMNENTSVTNSTTLMEILPCHVMLQLWEDDLGHVHGGDCATAAGEVHQERPAVWGAAHWGNQHQGQVPDQICVRGGNVSGPRDSFAIWSWLTKSQRTH